MTMDAVAERAGASKATLYRHWPNKAELVVAAIRHMKGDAARRSPDTGRLRDDLAHAAPGTQPHSAEDQLCVMRGMVSACGADAELAPAFYEQVVDAKRSAALELMRRAQERGEVSEATDIQFLVDAAPAMLIFRHLLTPHPVDEEYLARLVDDVWLPLLTARRSCTRALPSPRPTAPPPPPLRRSMSTPDQIVETEEHAHAPKNLGLALIVICTAQLMVVLDATIVNIALPSIQNDLGFTPANLQWVLTAYTLAFGGFLLLGGRAGDILGRRRVFIFGILLFTSARSAAASPGAKASLLVFRAIQGLGAAIAAPTALSLIATEFPEGKERNRAMGVYAAMSGAGAAVGLILGGLLTEFDWRWVMFVNVPIGIFIALVAPRALHRDRAAHRQVRPARRDHRHPGSRSAGLRPHPRSPPTSARTRSWGRRSRARRHGPTRTNLTILAVSVILLVAFVIIEARASTR